MGHQSTLIVLLASPVSSSFASNTRQSGLWRSLVSASVWGTEGRGFESRQPDWFLLASVKDLGAAIEASELVES